MLHSPTLFVDNGNATGRGAGADFDCCNAEHGFEYAAIRLNVLRECLAGTRIDVSAHGTEASSVLCGRYRYRKPDHQSLGLPPALSKAIELRHTETPIND